MIEVENLSKKYGDKLAVDDLSFTSIRGTRLRATEFGGSFGAASREKGFTHLRR